MTCQHCSTQIFGQPFIVGGMMFCNTRHASEAMNHVIEHHAALRSMQQWLNATPTYGGTHE